MRLQLIIKQMQSQVRKSHDEVVFDICKNWLLLLGTASWAYALLLAPEDRYRVLIQCNFIDLYPSFLSCERKNTRIRVG